MEAFIETVGDPQLGAPDPAPPQPAAKPTRRKRLRRLGKQPARYRFFLNSYEDVRFTSCPRCSTKTLVRKYPLVIHVDPQTLLTLRKTCRYCPRCELIIAHRNELEAELAGFFARNKPEDLGNDYLVVGTIDAPLWKRGLTVPLTLQELLDNLHDFRDVWRFEPPHYGWGR